MLLFTIRHVHPIQKKLLDLADTVDLGQASYYQLAKQLGVNHPYKVKFALDQLEKKGHIVKNHFTGQIIKLTENQEHGALISVPYYGEANCGTPLSIAEDTIKDFLRLSPSILDRVNIAKLFAFKARGDSMNKANISGQGVNDGDFILAERIERYQVKNGDYILSIIQGNANLKRIFIDTTERQLVLYSESTSDHPPIIISTLDADDSSVYEPIGRAVQILKMTHTKSYGYLGLR